MFGSTQIFYDDPVYRFEPRYKNLTFLCFFKSCHKLTNEYTLHMTGIDIDSVDLITDVGKYGK